MIPVCFSFNRRTSNKWISPETKTEGTSWNITQLIIAIVALIIGWVIISIPLWLAAKVLTGEEKPPWGQPC